MKRILCIGSVTTDILVSTVDNFPKPGVLQAVQNTNLRVGGCAANAASDLAILGVPVTLSCKVGADWFGNFVKAEVAKTGVDISGIVADETAPTTSSIVCIRSDGERSFLYNPGSAAAYRKEDIPEELIDASDIVFVAGAMLLTSFDGAPCAEVLKMAREKGKYTVMDTAWDFDDVWLPKIADALADLDLFMPSYDEAARLSGKEEPAEIADFFFAAGVKSVIIKLGKQGAYFCPTPEERFTLPTYRSIRSVDSTGAGDSFCAGFLCGLAQDWDFEKSGRFANAVGTHCIQAVGASAGIRPMAEILDFMEKTPLE